MRLEPPQCSTPFGITAVGSFAALLFIFPNANVLNAFRHHGCREVGAESAGDGEGQVLNAFRHHGCRESKPSARAAVSPCAQRLSASRLSGDDAAEYLGHVEACSTPFGITAVGRHVAASHRGGRMCSTPFGITAVGRVTKRIHRGEIIECSTPFGITAVGRPLPLRRADAAQVLNAFRHHGCREVLPVALVVSYSGAQRLSASRLSGAKTLATPLGPQHGAQRLSASRLSGASAAR